MEFANMLPAEERLQRTRQESPPVRMELLPAWKQVIIESRQAQTTSMLLVAELKRRRMALEKQVAISRQQRFVLFDRLSYFFF